jgi:uncharacterized damage-inducible protein DinB
MTQINELLATYDRETAITRTLLQRLTNETLSWKPHQKSTSMEGLGRHLAHMFTWGLLSFTQSESDMNARTPMPPTQTVEDILTAFDRNVIAVRSLIAKSSDKNLQEMWSLTHDGQTIMTMSRSNVIYSMILSHMIHHRGQLSVYLRLNEIPVPSIYGPSADEPMTP